MHERISTYCTLNWLDYDYEWSTQICEPGHLSFLDGCLVNVCSVCAPPLLSVAGVYTSIVATIPRWDYAHDCHYKYVPLSTICVAGYQPTFGCFYSPSTNINPHEPKSSPMNNHHSPSFIAHHSPWFINHYHDVYSIITPPLISSNSIMNQHLSTIIIII